MQEGDSFFIEVVAFLDIISKGEEVALYYLRVTKVCLRGSFIVFFGRLILHSQPY